MATKRNYQPTLRLLLHGVDLYIARNRTRIEAGLTAPQLVALLAFVSCLLDLINALGETPVVD